MISDKYHVPTVIVEDDAGDAGDNATVTVAENALFSTDPGEDRDVDDGSDETITLTLEEN